jgi:hypothetical protein
MGPEERLELIGTLLASAPTNSGVLGREIAAARALAENEDPLAVAALLEEAKQVGSPTASACLDRLWRPEG